MSKQPKFININGRIICRKSIKMVYIGSKTDEIVIVYHEPYGHRIIDCESKQEAMEILADVDHRLCSPQD